MAEGKYTLKIIRAMSLVEIKQLLDWMGWGRAAHGRIAHLWPNGGSGGRWWSETLCDKRMRLARDGYLYWEGKCGKCERRKNELERRERRLMTGIEDKEGMPIP